MKANNIFNHFRTGVVLNFDEDCRQIANYIFAVNVAFDHIRQQGSR
jgi:hypothetical protein